MRSTPPCFRQAVFAMLPPPHPRTPLRPPTRPPPPPPPHPPPPHPPTRPLTRTPARTHAQRHARRPSPTLPLPLPSPTLPQVVRKERADQMFLLANAEANAEQAKAMRDAVSVLHYITLQL